MEGIGTLRLFMIGLSQNNRDDKATIAFRFSYRMQAKRRDLSFFLLLLKYNFDIKLAF